MEIKFILVWASGVFMGMAWCFPFFGKIGPLVAIVSACFSLGFIIAFSKENLKKREEKGG